MCHVDGSIGLLLKSTPVMLSFESFSPPLIKCLQKYSSPFVNKCSMKSHLLAKKRRREDLNLALCWTVSVTVSLCWTSTNIISICNILYLQCIKWLQFCTVKVRYLGCTQGKFLLRQASQNLELFAKILPSNENNTAAGMARYLVSAEEANFSTGEVLFSFVMPAWQGRSQ